MEINSVDISILRTKLHRPPISSDHIHRIRLLERLNKNRYKAIYPDLGTGRLRQEHAGELLAGVMRTPQRMGVAI
jgi:hypothetical protein